MEFSYPQRTTNGVCFKIGTLALRRRQSETYVYFWYVRLTGFNVPSSRSVGARSDIAVSPLSLVKRPCERDSRRRSTFCWKLVLGSIQRACRSWYFIPCCRFLKIFRFVSLSTPFSLLLFFFYVLFNDCAISCFVFCVYVIGLFFFFQ